MKIALRKSRHFDTPRFEMFPTEFLRCTDLAVNRVGPFVADA
jgi:hypothetical protein